MYFVLTLVESMYFVLTLVESMYFVLTRMPCKSYRKRTMSSCDVFQALINPLFVDFIQSVIQLFQALINSLFVDFIQSVMQLFVCFCFYPRHNLTAARASPQRLST